MAKEQNSSQEIKGPKTKILPCICQHKAQDELHGKGNRVYNKTTSQYRCTVCAALKNA